VSPPVAQQVPEQTSFWVLAAGLLLSPVASALATAIAPRLPLTGTAADACAFAGATLFPIVGLSLAAMVELRLTLTLAAAAGAVALLVALAVLRPAAVAAVVLVDGALVCLAWALGATLGRRVQHPAHLLPACVVAASADFVSLLSPEGPSHAIAKSELALSVLAVWFPVPGSSDMAPALGIGDLLFMALAFGVARAHALPYGRCVLACALGTALAGIAAACSGRAVPALVPIAGLIVLALPAARRLRRSDRTVALCSMLLAVTVALATLTRTLLTAR